MQIQADKVKSGLVDPVQDSQTIFRQILKAMSEPGITVKLEQAIEPPAYLTAASYAVALTLFDHETRFACGPDVLDDEALSSILFYCSSMPVVNLGRADFVFCNESQIPDLEKLNPGTDAFPHQSCTLIVQCKSLQLGNIVNASGPGIQQTRKIICSALSSQLLEQRRNMQTLFPLGIDMIFTCNNELLALPRTTILKMEIA